MKTKTGVKNVLNQTLNIHFQDVTLFSYNKGYYKIKKNSSKQRKRQQQQKH